MLKSTYNKLKAIFDGLKNANENSIKLPTVTRSAVDFSVLLATRSALEEWDKENCPHENFFEFLLSEIADAEYNVSVIIAKREGIK